MKTDSLKFTVIVSVTLIIMQSTFMIIPLNTIQMYNMVLRPLVYAVLTAMVYTFIGLDARPVCKVNNANKIAVISVAMFGIVFLSTAFLFGFSTNRLTLNLPFVVGNIWERGFIILLGELIRYKVIKAINLKDRTSSISVFAIYMLTIVLAYGRMNTLNIFTITNVSGWNVFFELLFSPIVISAISSYIVIEGNYISIFLINFVYTMTPYLVPIIPDVSPVAWSLITSGLGFITAVTYYYVINDKSRIIRIREKRAARYAKRPVFGYMFTVALISVIVAFFIGVFPIYPVVVLTGSMSGSIERGSIALIERIPPGEVFVRVDEGEVIHFLNRGRVEYVHRVVDFRHDEHGQRQYITRGDASDMVDPFPVPQEDVLGIVRAFLPFFGYPYIFVRAIRGS